MLLVIAYSCFTSSYYVAFDFPTELSLIILEHFVFASFTFEIIFKFMVMPPNTDVNERSHMLIIKRYLKSGQFFVDFLATFPFYLIQNNDSEDNNNAFGVLFKLLRMVRIPKILNLLDMYRFNKFLEAMVSGQTRGKRVQYNLIMKNIFKVIRLIMLTIIITYFTGCCFYFVSSLQDPSEYTFLTNPAFNLNTDQVTNFQKFVTVCYFSITTLSTVGYGDFYPISNVEKIMGIVIMLAGVAFFSFVMSSFIEIISNFSRNLGPEEETFEMHNWMTLLTRFRENKPLPNSLYR